MPTSGFSPVAEGMAASLQRGATQMQMRLSEQQATDAHANSLADLAFKQADLLLLPEKMKIEEQNAAAGRMRAEAYMRESTSLAQGRNTDEQNRLSTMVVNLVNRIFYDQGILPPGPVIDAAAKVLMGTMTFANFYTMASKLAPNGGLLAGPPRAKPGAAGGAPSGATPPVQNVPTPTPAVPNVPTPTQQTPGGGLDPALGIAIGQVGGLTTPPPTTGTVPNVSTQPQQAPGGGAGPAVGTAAGVLPAGTPGEAPGALGGDSGWMNRVKSPAEAIPYAYKEAGDELAAMGIFPPTSLTPEDLAQHTLNGAEKLTADYQRDAKQYATEHQTRFRAVMSAYGKVYVQRWAKEKFAEITREHEAALGVQKQRLADSEKYRDATLRLRAQAARDKRQAGQASGNRGGRSAPYSENNRRISDWQRAKSAFATATTKYQGNVKTLALFESQLAALKNLESKGTALTENDQILLEALPAQIAILRGSPGQPGILELSKETMDEAAEYVRQTRGVAAGAAVRTGRVVWPMLPSAAGSIRPMAPGAADGIRSMGGGGRPRPKPAGGAIRTGVSKSGVHWTARAK